ncbi:MAG TPA: PAS domain S-box protein [Terriglobia bacterium]|nr:PAS domain S-box protein [Terriglobia bacterium]
MSLNAGKPRMPSGKPNRHLEEIARLKSQVQTLEQTLETLRSGGADALVVPGKAGDQIFTVRGGAQPYRVFVESMNEGAAIVAADATIVYSNLRFADMVGMPLDKVIGASFFQFVPTQCCPVLEELHEEKGAAGYRGECELKRANGEVVPVQLSVRPMTTDGVRRLCIIATDISDRKLAEEKLLASERQLRLIFDQIPAAVWTTDKDLHIVSASGTVVHPALLRSEEIIGKTVREFFDNPEELSPPLVAHLAALKGEHRSYEYNLAGNIFSVTVQPLRNAFDEIAGVIGIALDVTENKRAIASVAKLAAIVESSQDAIFGSTLGGYITSWNRGAEQLFGYSAGEVAGQHISIITPEDRRNEPEEVLEKLKRGELVKPFETVRRRKDGSLVDLSVTVSAVKDPRGHINGVAAIAHDIADRKQVEKELKELSARLLQVQDEERRNMARELHDSVIQGLAAAVINLSLLKDSIHLDPEAARTLDATLKIIEDSVREIRTFSYLLHPPLLDVNGLQSALRWYVEGYSKRSGVRVELNLPDKRERLGNDIELALFRIVQESLTNIHRHSGSSRATIRMQRTENEVTLVVSDDGHGMDAQTLEKVRREGAVLGVGIAGMKQRLQQLGGKLNIASGGNGTSVKASVPVD